MTFLIAGYGDLGQHIAKQWQSNPHDIPGPILALRRHPDAHMESSHLHFLAADLTQADSLSQLPQDISHVVYCASADRSDEAAYQQAYVQGLTNLLDQLQHQSNAPRFLFVSSTAVYAKTLEGDVDESSPTQPGRYNGQVMLDAETLLLERLPQALILRLSGIYGPGRHHLLRRLQSGAATVPSDSGYWANRIHIEDAARAVLHLLSQAHLQGVFIGSDNEPLPLREVYQDLARQIQAPEPKTAAASALMGKKRLLNQKLRNSGFQFNYPDSRLGYHTVVESYLRELSEKASQASSPN